MAEENRLFQVEIITPDRVFYTGEGDMIEFTTASGEIGVYKKHIPLTTVLAPGIVKIHKTGEDDVIAAVHSGFAEILPDKVTLLAEIAEWPNEIDRTVLKQRVRVPRNGLPTGQRQSMSNVLNLHFAKHWCVLILQNKIYLTEIKFTGYNIVPKPFYGVDFS